MPYGIIYSKSYWEDMSDFSANGAIISLVGNKIVLTHDSAKATLNLNYNTLLEHWKVSAKIKAISAEAIIGIGTRSINGYQTFSVYCTIDFSTGFLNIYSTNNTAKKLVAKSNDSLSIKTNEDVVITIERKVDTIIAHAQNNKKGSSAITAKYTYITNNYAVPSPNTGTFSLYADQGSFILDSLALTSEEMKNTNLLIVTDSKGMYLADSFGSRWPQQISNSLKPTVLSIGGTDGVNELLARLPEIIALSPANVLLAVGRNDVNFRMKADTLKARYSRAVSRLVSAGIEVYHLNCIYETSLGQNNFSKWITSKYGKNVIDTYNPTSKTPNFLSPTASTPTKLVITLLRQSFSNRVN
jgi:hypothetical protein